ncbi:hypothetical protein D6774_02655 [Candidatus Woesearchaeota archaeon]|nr:MAG: hypothetical protein D6774_02655 [Candidatus Woesearchaeota archaeon]
MSLYEILNERGCLNLLKELFDVECIYKTSHGLKLSQIKDKLPSSLNITLAANVLHKEGLIELEELENDAYLALTGKGKRFFEQFDKLKHIFEGEEEQAEKTRIEYNITELEQKILILCYKLQQETGTIVPLRTLTQEVYPNKNTSNRIGAISQYVSRLAELNLMEKIKTKQKTYAKVTPSGERAIKEQFMESVL